MILWFEPVLIFLAATVNMSGGYLGLVPIR